MQLNLKLDDFTGPLDLLLTLVKSNKMDINNINVAQLTDQYLAFIYADTNEKYIAESSEYLLMASTLIRLKSKLMISAITGLSPEEQNQLDIENQKLINQILLYRKYKETLSFFNEKYDERNHMLNKKSDDLTTMFPDKVNKIAYVLPEKMNVDSLLKAMNEAYEKWKLNLFNDHKIVVQEISAEQVEKELIKLIKKHKKVKKMSLSDFLLLIGETILTEQFFVTCFVCLLDLTKNGIISLDQKKIDDEIYITFNDVNWNKKEL